MKIFVTRYVLTKGILVFEAEAAEGCENMVVVKGGAGRFRTYFHKPYWYTSLDEAIAHARKILEKKVSSLETSLMKFQSITNKSGWPRVKDESAN